MLDKDLMQLFGMLDLNTVIVRERGKSASPRPFRTIPVERIQINVLPAPAFQLSRTGHSLPSISHVIHGCALNLRVLTETAWLVETKYSRVKKLLNFEKRVSAPLRMWTVPQACFQRTQR